MATVSVAVLLALAAPVLGMRTWPQDAGTQPAGSTIRQAYDLVAAEYGPGANGPLLVAVDLTHDHAPCRAGRQAAGRCPGSAPSPAPVLNAAGDAAVITVQPATGPSDDRDDAAAGHASARTRRRGVLVTGHRGDLRRRLAAARGPAVAGHRVRGRCLAAPA